MSVCGYAVCSAFACCVDGVKWASMMDRHGKCCAIVACACSVGVW